MEIRIWIFFCRVKGRKNTTLIHEFEGLDGTIFFLTNLSRELIKHFNNLYNPKLRSNPSSSFNIHLGKILPSYLQFSITTSISEDKIKKIIMKFASNSTLWIYSPPLSSLTTLGTSLEETFENQSNIFSSPTNFQGLLRLQSLFLFLNILMPLRLGILDLYPYAIIYTN